MEHRPPEEQHMSRADCYSLAVQMAPKFWARVTKGDGCWEWQGAHSGGYGSIVLPGHPQVGTHRIAWALANGRWPQKFVLHRCNNRGCVRPDHLYEGTVKQNAADALRAGAHRNARKTHCDNGHALTPENIRWTPKGWRECLICRAARADRRWAKKHGLRPRPGSWKDRSHCRKGHPYDAANTWIDPRHHRRCRECSRQRGRKRYAKKRQRR